MRFFNLQKLKKSLGFDIRQRIFKSSMSKTKVKKKNELELNDKLLKFYKFF